MVDSWLYFCQIMRRTIMKPNCFQSLAYVFANRERGSWSLYLIKIICKFEVMPRYTPSMLCDLISLFFFFLFRLCNGLCISASTFSCVPLLYQSRGGSDFVPCASDLSRQDCKDLPRVEYDCHDPWLPHGGERKSGAGPSSGRSVSTPTPPKPGQCHTSCYSSPCASLRTFLTLTAVVACLYDRCFRTFLT